MMFNVILAVRRGSACLCIGRRKHDYFTSLCLILSEHPETESFLCAFSYAAYYYYYIPTYILTRHIMKRTIDM